VEALILDVVEYKFNVIHPYSYLGKFLRRLYGPEYAKRRTSTAQTRSRLHTYLLLTPCPFLLSITPCACLSLLVAPEYVENMFKEKKDSMVGTMWYFINDSLRSPLCLVYPPDAICAGAIHLALRLKKTPVTRPGEDPKKAPPWFEVTQCDTRRSVLSRL
jgi:hypothetical protein